LGDFLRIVLDSLQFLWPFRIVRQWERAGYYVRGRFWKTIGPGVYPLVPWFMDIHTVSVVPAILTTPRLDITIKDGSVVSFQVSATVRVANLDLAVNGVDNYTETTQELVAAVVAEKLAEVDSDRLSPEKRGRLLSDLKKWAVMEAEQYGIEVQKLRFTTFVSRPKVFRLLGDGSTVPTW
jgi:hypothetical protein